MQNLGRVLLLLFLFSLAGSIWASPELDAKIKQNVAQILKTRDLRGAEVGVVVQSLKTNKILFARNPNLPLNPASNVKLITTLAALQILKPEFRFKTQYFMQGRDLVVKGFGDPSVTTERLREVAHQLKLRGLTEVRGNLVLDETYFDNIHYARGHDQERNNPKIWAAPVSALTLNRNGFEVFMRPTLAGEPAFVSIEPHSPYFRVVGHMNTTNKGFAPGIGLSSGDKEMTVHISGAIGKNVAPQSFYRRVTNPAAYFGESFRVILADEGIKVNGTVTSGSLTGEANLIYTDLSPRLTDVVNETNKISSNFMAETLVKVLGATVKTPATFEDGLAQIRQFLEQKVGLKHGEYVLGNGSGLNQTNRFSAAQIVRVLDFANRDFEISSEFMASLSVAGAQGTLARRLKDPFMHRQLRAKTGTLRHVSALSGYLAGDKDDILSFAILFDGHKSTAHRMVQIQDQISRKIAKEIRIIDHTDLDREVIFDDTVNEEDEEGEVAGGG